jgi:hypothetical protein
MLGAGLCLGNLVPKQMSSAGLERVETDQESNLKVLLDGVALRGPNKVICHAKIGQGCEGLRVGGEKELSHTSKLAYK